MERLEQDLLTLLGSPRLRDSKLSSGKGCGVKSLFLTLPLQGTPMGTLVQRVIARSDRQCVKSVQIVENLMNVGNLGNVLTRPKQSWLLFIHIPSEVYPVNKQHLIRFIYFKNDP